MSPKLYAYLALGIAILCEVVGTAFLQKSEQFSRLVPTLIMLVCYTGSFFFFSHALKSMPLGIAYAIWGGAGVTLVAVIGAVVFGQKLDLAAILGIGFVLVGIVLINVFSSSGSHGS